MTVLILCAAATWFMAGVHWFVQVVHDPLFADVGPDSFLAYHRRHSERTTLVVLPPMAVELVTSAWLRTAAWTAHGIVVAVLLGQATT